MNRKLNIVALVVTSGESMSQLTDRHSRQYHRQCPISPSEYIPEYIPSKYSSNTVLYDQGNISSRYSCSGSSIGRALSRAVAEPVVASSSLVVVAFLSAGDNSPTDPPFSMLFAKSDARRSVLFTAK